MIWNLQRGIALFLSWCLLLVGVGDGFADQADPSSQPPQAAEQSPEQLQQLVAPIALYPDSLIAQILPAATYPDQVVDAGKWMEQHKGLQGDQLAAEVDKQSWDASLKALTQFPAVLANMSRNLAWTSELGDAYVNQQQELSQAVQTMRERARQAGNLNTTPQEKVETQGNTIVIQPAETDVVYLPEYDPWLAYGAPMAIFPGWYSYPGLFLDGPGVGFGLGFGVGLFGGFGWGWHNWGFDWRHGGRVVYNHNTYISHSTSIVNRNSVRAGRTNFGRGAGRSVGGHEGFQGPTAAHAPTGTHSGAFSGFSHGGITRGNALRGQSSFGGFHGWHFDSDTGLKEVLYRRIGENELTAITICHQFVAGEKEYRANSKAGNPAEGSAAILVARAVDESAGGDPVLFHGYYYRELPTRPANGTRRGTGGNTPGGFALIAYPAEYRSSGVVTLVVTDGDVVYEKDLGANTAALASAMAAFRKDGTWHAADE
jgi:hypothetical protein